MFCRHEEVRHCYAHSVLFQVAAISDNDRGPRYAETVLNSLHETNRQRQSVCLELGSHQGTVNSPLTLALSPMPGRGD